MRALLLPGAVRPIPDTARGSGNPIRWVPPHAWSVTVSLAEESGYLLWRMEPTKKNRSDILPKTFLIGSVSEGWKEVVPLRRDLAPDVEYEIILESGEAYIVGLDFSLGDLRPGYILDFNENLVPTRRFPLRTTCTERLEQGS